MEPLTAAQKVEEIAEVSDEALNDWEREFIESMLAYEGKYTEKQIAVIERIYDKVCAGPL